MTLIWDLLETLGRSDRSHKWPKEGEDHEGKVTNLGEVQTLTSGKNQSETQISVGGRGVKTEH